MKKKQQYIQRASQKKHQIQRNERIKTISHFGVSHFISCQKVFNTQQNRQSVHKGGYYVCVDNIVNK